VLEAVLARRLALQDPWPEHMTFCLEQNERGDAPFGLDFEATTALRAVVARNGSCNDRAIPFARLQIM